jgi:hypothetical protein
MYRLPAVSSAIARGGDRPAETAAKPSPLSIKLPFPAMVEMTPLTASTRRIRKFWLSEIKAFPWLSTATLFGWFKAARAAGPESPENPEMPVPARVETNPLVETLRTAWLDGLGMYKDPSGPSATDAGCTICAASADPPSPE